MKKERLYISDLIDEPAIPYPAWYPLSQKLHEDTSLRDGLSAIHSCRFDEYSHPCDYTEIFGSISCGEYPVYHETYLVGRFGGKLMYLDRSGWRSMSITKDVFDMQGWLIRSV